jgi:O-antigen/teichoic acid export membrane protein
MALLFNWIFIPQLGAMGASIALMLTVCLGATIAVILAYRRFGALIRPLTVARVIVATVLMVFVDRQIPLVGPWLLLKFFVLLGVYSVLLGLLKELSREDLKSFALWQKKSP